MLTAFHAYPQAYDQSGARTSAATSPGAAPGDAPPQRVELALLPGEWVQRLNAWHTASRPGVIGSVTARAFRRTSTR